MRLLQILACLFFVGCPSEDDPDCNKVMRCEEDREMYCYELDNGCKDECHYYVFEQCYEVCLNDEPGTEEYQNW